jgi:hypothetical protein
MNKASEELMRRLAETVFQNTNLLVFAQCHERHQNQTN